MSKNKSALDRNTPLWLYLPGVVVLGIVTYLYLFNWDVAFSSDTALISLMAKRIAFFGERPIFVWKVGYQGILVEAYLTALFFKIWGMGHWTANLAPTLVFYLALFVWTYLLEKTFDRLTAQCTLLLTVLGCPLIYQMNLRTFPNYPEAFLIGGLFLLCYRVYLPRVRTDSEKALGTLALAFAMGFLAGFGVYTFALAGYFMIAAFAHLGVLYLRKMYEMFGSFINVVLFPFLQLPKGSLGRKCVVFLTAVAWVGVAAGVYLATVSILGKKSWDFISIFFPAFSLIALLNIVLCLAKGKPTWRLSAYSFVIGGLIGNSPALYYKLILHGHSIKRLGLGGKWEAIGHRLSYLFEAQRWLFGLRELPVTAGFVFAIALLGSIWFLVYFGKRIWKFIQGKEVSGINQWPPFFFLPLIMVAIFMCTYLVRDKASSRYLVFLFPCYALMTSWAGLRVWERVPKVWVRSALIATCLVIFTKSAWILHYDLTVGKNAARYEKLIRTLEENKLAFGYAGYWNAYAINFLTDEKIVLEPLNDNYCPYYGPQVRSQKRIAWLSEPAAMPSIHDGVLELEGNRYRVEKSTLLGEYDLLLILRKLDG
jgi:hypothetical protein